MGDVNTHARYGEWTRFETVGHPRVTMDSAGNKTATYTMRATPASEPVKTDADRTAAH